jgi:hypothetical protein
MRGPALRSPPSSVCVGPRSGSFPLCQLLTGRLGL